MRRTLVVRVFIYEFRLFLHKKFLKYVIKKGTCVPNMGTLIHHDNLSATLFGKTRRAVLSLLFTHADESVYLRQIARISEGGIGAVQREVEALSKAGIIRRTVQGRHVYYQANTECPVFTELKSLITKTAGVSDVLKTALGSLADRISLSFIYGSVARLEDDRKSDIDVLITGDVSFAEIVAALQQAQEILGREINPSVYPDAEFQRKLAAGNHFLKTVLSEPLIFIVGDKDELARLVEKRLAD